MMQENKKKCEKNTYIMINIFLLSIVGNVNKKREDLILHVSSGIVQSVNFGNLLRGCTFSTVPFLKNSYNLVQEVK